MDIKKIISIVDGADSKSVIVEGKNMAKDMVMQHYQQPKPVTTKPYKSKINEYFKVVNDETLQVIKESQESKKVEVKRIVDRVLERLDESKKTDAPKPRNFVAKNQKTSGAGAHKDKKKAEKQGDVKHKKQAVALDEAATPKDPGFKPNLEVPTAPELPEIELKSGVNDLGDGVQVTVNPDGTKTHSSGQGTFTFDKSNKAIKYQSPSFGGMSQEHDLVTGNIIVRYMAGPLSASQTYDKTGKVLDTNADYTMGATTVGMSKDAKGITSKRMSSQDPSIAPSGKDLYAMGNKDKEATYDKAMAQVAKTQAPNSETNLKEGVAGPKKCWPGHRKVGTQPGTGKNKGKRVNDCEKIKENVIEVGAPVKVYSNVLKKAVFGKIVNLKEGYAYVNYNNTKIIMKHPVLSEADMSLTQLGGAAGTGVTKAVVAKTGAKTAAKFIPGAGSAISAFDAYNRWKEGDRTGAVISALAGVGWLVPGPLGWALGGSLDAANLGRDLAKGDKKPEVAATPDPKAAKAPAAAAGKWPTTPEEIKAFQKANKDKDGQPLVPDGLIGARTYQALVKAGYKAPSNFAVTAYKPTQAPAKAQAAAPTATPAPAQAATPAPATTSTQTNTKTSVSGTIKMGKPEGPIQFNGKTVNPGDPEYASASQALLAQQQKMQQFRTRGERTVDKNLATSGAPVYQGASQGLDRDY